MLHPEQDAEKGGPTASDGGSDACPYRRAAGKIVREAGPREPGLDDWNDKVIRRAFQFARAQPQESWDDLGRHFWPVIAEATGADGDELHGRLRGKGHPGSGRHRQNGHAAPSRGPGRVAGFRFDAIDSATFARADYKPRWLVHSLAVAGMPLLVGGPKKAHKTSLLVDFVISLGTGSPFLGHFRVSERVRAALFSGESGGFTLQETARRVCESKGVRLADADVLWGFRLPQLADPVDLDELRYGLGERKVKVVVIDPLYLCALGGLLDLQASNLFHMGPLLFNVATACLEVGCTPVLAHHFKQTRPNPYDEPQLEDLAFAGVQEFARQWLLLGRRERFEPGSHRLWLSAGGSVGFSGLWGLDLEEGPIAEDFTGRRWAVTVRTAEEVRGERAEAGDAKKQAKQERADRADEAKVLDSIDRLTRVPAQAQPSEGSKKVAPKQPTRTDVQMESRLSPARAKRAIERLIRSGEVQEVEIVIQTGRNHKVRKAVAALRKVQSGSTATETTDLISGLQSSQSGQSL